MTSYNYLESPNPNLLIQAIQCCCICRSPFIGPYTTRTCFHTFCYECIASAITVNQQCPIDRTPLALADLQPADPLIRNLVDELVVNCPRQSLGCRAVCQRHLLPVHLKDACQYLEITCPEESCSCRVLKKDLQDHKCALSSAQKDHTEGVEDVARDEHESPEDVGSSDSSCPPPTSTSRASTDLVAENAMLRVRLSALENIVHTLRSEMFAVKHALGPWYPQDLQARIMAHSQFEDADASMHLSAGTVVRDPMQTPPAVPEHTASPDPTDIASYFPPAEDVLEQPSATDDRRRSPASPPTGTFPAIFPGGPPTGMYGTHAFATSGQAHGSYPHGASSYPGSAYAISLPPLDPTMPLPDTLASLHSSLGTLAGALGANASARAAESLRTTEELRGVRAAMHGLRMQAELVEVLIGVVI
ncbi:uncharacterized protein BXZ73DRAFT_74557 [Epithele typhae]|uniref:uncharacterized protein n=1 Tax=Epithele typhae TaxID=378194 RepID=UPI0020072C11|nr:uncharacterized protein BXZ73DRAFT_74557 [Epithele typhae]KAH9942272.1 hypothetical protein BXZ73DRAFT_74557 [Epithele typhae]